MAELRGVDGMDEPIGVASDVTGVGSGSGGGGGEGLEGVVMGGRG